MALLKIKHPTHSLNNILDTKKNVLLDIFGIPGISSTITIQVEFRLKYSFSTALNI